MGRAFPKLFTTVKRARSVTRAFNPVLSQLKSTRLGLRFENLLWFWLQEDNYHPYQLLGHSIQKLMEQKL